MNRFQRELIENEIYIKGRKTFSVVEDQSILKILNWNIERGYNPDEICAYIASIKPDIVCLQEVDWGNRRTDKLDITEYIANKTSMLGIFGIEFYEIQSHTRTKRSAGGGVHGNAILTRLEPIAYYRANLPVCYDWENPPRGMEKIAIREKRKGRRFALCVEFSVADKIITVCSVHLEDKAGGTNGRWKQVTQVMNAIQSRNTEIHTSIIGGDLNTLENWLSRLTRFRKPDHIEEKPWYLSECRWWKEKLLLETGYFDPFSCKDWTYEIKGIYREKLDWLLIKNATILEFGIGEFNSSDHRPIWARIKVL